MRRLLALVIALPALAACGSGGGGGGGIASSEACTSAFQPFEQKLQEIDSRLDVGMTQPDFNDALGAARVAYDQASGRFRDLPVECLNAGTQLENAYNSYLAANKRWSQCIGDQYCDVQSDALPELRVDWRYADRYIRQAKSMLG